MEKVSFRNDIIPLKDMLFRLALRITMSRADAEDIVQETMIRVWRRRDSWQNIDSIEAFCITICRNLALDRVRERERHGHKAAIDETPERADSAATPMEQILRREQIEAIRRIVDALPEKQKSCMQLRDFEGRAYKDIAAALDMTEEQVKVNIFRARQAVKKQIQKTINDGL